MARQTSLTHIKPPVYLHLPNKSIYYHLCQPLLLPFFPSLCSPECMFARIKQGQRLLSSSLLLKTNYSCECTPRSLSPNSLSSPAAPLALNRTRGEGSLLPQQASASLCRLYSRAESGQVAVAIPSLRSAFSLHSLSLMKCGGAKATLHKLSGTLCYHRQTMIKFQTGDAGVVR